MGAEWLDVFLMPPGLGGLGIGKGPFETASDKKTNKERDALQAAQNPLPTPVAPTAEAQGDKAQELVKKKKAAMTRTVYTSPLGVAGEADVARKTLLGQ